MGETVKILGETVEILGETVKIFDVEKGSRWPKRWLLGCRNCQNFGRNCQNFRCRGGLKGGEESGQRRPDQAGAPSERFARALQKRSGPRRSLCLRPPKKGGPRAFRLPLRLPALFKPPAALGARPACAPWKSRRPYRLRLLRFSKPQGPLPIAAAAVFEIAGTPTG